MLLLFFVLIVTISCLQGYIKDSSFINYRPRNFLVYQETFNLTTTKETLEKDEILQFTRLEIINKTMMELENSKINFMSYGNLVFTYGEYILLVVRTRFLQVASYVIDLKKEEETFLSESPSTAILTWKENIHIWIKIFCEYANNHKFIEYITFTSILLLIALFALISACCCKKKKGSQSPNN